MLHLSLNAAAEAARGKGSDASTSVEIRNVILDLASFESIRLGVQPVLASGLPIDVWASLRSIHFASLELT